MLDRYDSELSIINSQFFISMRSTFARALVVAGCTVLALLLFAIAPRALGRFGVPAAGIAAPITIAGNAVGNWVITVSQLMRTPRLLEARDAEITDLRTARMGLERDLARAYAELENAHVATVLPPTTIIRTPARVTAATLTGTTQELTVIYGDGSEVAVGDPVVVRGVLIGTIVASGSRRAVVRLLTDPDTQIAAALTTSGGTIGIVEANPGGGLVLTHIPNDRVVRAGAGLVTSAANDTLPPGLPIGTASEAHPDADGFFHFAPVTPLVDAHRSLMVEILHRRAHA